MIVRAAYAGTAKVAYADDCIDHDMEEVRIKITPRMLSFVVECTLYRCLQIAFEHADIKRNS